MSRRRLGGPACNCGRRRSSTSPSITPAHWAGLRSAATGVIRRRAKAFNPAPEERLLRRSLLHNLRELPDGRWTWKYDRGHPSQETFEKIRASLPGLTERLPSITCPALVVRGAESDVLSNDDAERFAAALPNGRSVSMANAGHTVQGDNPRALAEALREFLAGVA